MKAAVYVVPCAGVLKAAGETGSTAGAGLVVAALRTAERLEQPADLVLLAVPAGQGEAIASRLLASDRGTTPRRPARYLSERDLGDEDLDDLVTGNAAASIAPRGRTRPGDPE